jgi:hypothetical protein
MQLPYTCMVYRTVVLEHARRKPEPAPQTPGPSASAIMVGEQQSPAASHSMHDTAMRLPRVVVDGLGAKSAGDGDGDDLILIDFR